MRTEPSKEEEEEADERRKRQERRCSKQPRQRVGIKQDMEAHKSEVEGGERGGGGGWRNDVNTHSNWFLLLLSHQHPGSQY